MPSLLLPLPPQSIRVVLTPTSAAHSLRIRCAAGTQVARWLKWGKTGNHLFLVGIFVVLTSHLRRTCKFSHREL